MLTDKQEAVKNLTFVFWKVITVKQNSWIAEKCRNLSLNASEFDNFSLKHCIRKLVNIGQINNCGTNKILTTTSLQGWQ